jgi:hypothetical protein
VAEPVARLIAPLAALAPRGSRFVAAYFVVARGRKACPLAPSARRRAIRALIAEGLLKDRCRQLGLAPHMSKLEAAERGPRVRSPGGTLMMELPKIIVAGVSTVALAGGIGAGLAYADTPSDEPTSSPTTTATSSPAETSAAAEPRGRRAQNGFRKPLVRRQLRFIARSLHGEVTLAGDEHRVIAFQRGAVQKVSGTSLTVKSNDGFVGTYVLSDKTNVRENGDQAKLSDIDTSDRVLVVATKDDSTLNARRVIVRDD